MAVALSAESLLESARFRRLIVVSAVGHVVLALVLSYAPSGVVPLDEPPPIMVDLVQAPRQVRASVPAAPKPVEKPVALPKPVPAPPPKEEVKPIPKEEPKPKPKEVAKPEPKPKPKEEPKPKPKVEPKREPAPPALTAEQLLAQIQQKVSERPAEPAAPAVDGNGTPHGRFDPELAAYRQQLIALLSDNWVGARAFRNQGKLEVHYEVRIDGGGGVSGVELRRASGNSHFDQSAERAIWKSNPFPRPPRGELVLDVSFDPTGVF